MSDKGPSSRKAVCNSESSISLHSIGSTYQSPGTKKSLSDRIYAMLCQGVVWEEESNSEARGRSLMMAREMWPNLTVWWQSDLLVTGIAPPLTRAKYACDWKWATTWTDQSWPVPVAAKWAAMQDENAAPIGRRREKTTIGSLFFIQKGSYYYNLGKYSLHF